MNTTLEQLERLAEWQRDVSPEPWSFPNVSPCDAAFIVYARGRDFAAIAQQVRKMQDELAAKDAEIERLREEGKRDYDGMREMQAKFIAADSELAAARKVIERLRGVESAAKELLFHIAMWRDGGVTIEGCQNAEKRLNAALAQPAKGEVGK